MIPLSTRRTTASSWNRHRRRLILFNSRKIESDEGGCCAVHSDSSNSRRTAGTTTASSTTVEEMRRRFSETTKDERGSGDGPQETANSIWETLWADGITPWDLGGPTPALRAELGRRYRLLRRKAMAGIPRCVLVPGCGAGYDLVTLARHFDNLIVKTKAPDSDSAESSHLDTLSYRRCTVVGLDVSETSLDRAAREIESAYHFCPFESRPTTAQLVKGDFFSSPSTWKLQHCFGGGCEGSVGNDGTESEYEIPCKFDLIFDYTFFCALNPSLRKKWGESMSRLLDKRSGNLLTLMFPAVADDYESNEIGPPFLVRPKDYRNVLEPHGWRMETSKPYENPYTHPNRRGQEVVAWWGYVPGEPPSLSNTSEQ